MSEMSEIPEIFPYGLFGKNRLHYEDLMPPLTVDDLRLQLMENKLNEQLHLLSRSEIEHAEVGF